MTDLEITKLCAEAMGCTETLDTVWGSSVKNPVPHVLYRLDGQWRNYDPLHDDSQALALVLQLRLSIRNEPPVMDWIVMDLHGDKDTSCFSAQNLILNRAICECVAKMQEAKA